MYLPLWFLIIAVLYIVAICSNEPVVKNVSHEKSDEELHRDYLCEEPRKPIGPQTPKEAMNAHTSICKIHGCKGLHRSHV